MQILASGAHDEKCAYQGRKALKGKPVVQMGNPRLLPYCKSYGSQDFGAGSRDFGAGSRDTTKMEQRWAKRVPRWIQDRQRWTNMRPKRARKISQKCSHSRQISDFVEVWVLRRMLDGCWTDVIRPTEGQNEPTCGQYRGQARTKMEKR